MIEYRELKKNALKELKSRWDHLKYEMEDPENEMLVEAMMKLRELPEKARATLADFLHGTEFGDWLEKFTALLDQDSHLMVLSVVEDLVKEIRWSILDSGYVRAFRVVLEDDASGRREARWFLCIDEDTPPATIAYNELLGSMTQGFPSAKLVSVKRTGFNSVAEFAKMLQVFGSEENWDGYDFTGSGELDKLFCSYELGELLNSSVPIRGLSREYVSPYTVVV